MIFNQKYTFTSLASREEKSRHSHTNYPQSDNAKQNEKVRTLAFSDVPSTSTHEYTLRAKPECALNTSAKRDCSATSTHPRSSCRWLVRSHGLGRGSATANALDKFSPRRLCNFARKKKRKRKENAAEPEKKRARTGSRAAAETKAAAFLRARARVKGPGPRIHIR